MTDQGRLRGALALQEPAAPARLVLASRGDALTEHLLAALQRRFPGVQRIDPELTPQQRYRVAALTLRAGRSRWVERFYKSAYAYRLRSLNAQRQLKGLPERPAAVLQVHALFAPTTAPTVLYVDCTHRQSAQLWPAWNPLRGRALQRWFAREGAAYTAAAHLFAFSEPTRESLIRDYGVEPHRVTVTGAGANLSDLPPMDRRAPTAPTVLFIGNDFVRKGGEVLLEAFRAVRAALPDARLVLVGTGPGVTPQPGVEVLGRIRDRSRIAALYAEASVFVVPSFFDPYPLVLLEAMAFGAPVVATRQTGTPEMIADGETGLLIEPGRADALAAALLRVLNDPALAARLGAAGRRAVEERFTWDAVVDRMAPALQRLAAEAQR